MKCYYCGARLNRTNTCPSCRRNVYVWKRAKFVSNFLYNDGLELAKRRDFTGAQESLVTSLQYDKRNTQARNLLGLIYYEIGEWYAAAVQWNISLGFEAEDNIASAYLEELQDSTSQVEQTNQAIRKYNQCLQYCKQKTYDLAQIQLKKVFELNPNFLKGYQLAALLQMREGAYDEAMVLLKRAAAIDRRNPDTRLYINECRKHLTKDGKLLEPETKKRRSLKEVFLDFQDKVVIAAVTNIAIGVAAGLAVFGFLVLPAMRQSETAQNSQELIAANETVSAKDQEITALEQQIETLQKQIEEEQAGNTEAMGRIDQYNTLVAAFDDVNNKDYEYAKDKLAEVDRDALDEASAEAYDALDEKIERNLQALAEEQASEEENSDEEDNSDGEE